MFVPYERFLETFNIRWKWCQETLTLTAWRGYIGIVFTLMDTNIMVTEERFITGYGLIPYNRSFSLIDPIEERNGWVMIPVHTVAEVFGFEIGVHVDTGDWWVWEEPRYLTVDDVTILIWDSSDDVINRLGEPDRIDPSLYVYDWWIYNSDYSRYMMVGVLDGWVQGLYTMAVGFKSSAGNYGDEGEYNALFYNGDNYWGSDIAYYDPYHGKRVGNRDLRHPGIYAVHLTNTHEDRSLVDEAYLRVLEWQSFELINAFRASYGLELREWSELAALTARQHSEDMARNNMLSHTLTARRDSTRRFHDNGGNGITSENIGTGDCSVAHIIHGSIRSHGHRWNLTSSVENGAIGIGIFLQDGGRTWKTFLFVHER
jgi:hypothetical protein